MRNRAAGYKTKETEDTYSRSSSDITIAADKKKRFAAAWKTYDYQAHKNDHPFLLCLVIES